jgi:hypothetical protein
MAEAVTPDRSNEPVKAAEELPRLERPKAVHGGRFLVGYAAVVLMAGAALLTLGMMSRGGTTETAAAERWGAIPLQKDGFQRIREIASKVANQYKGANGEQLAAVTATPGEVQGLPLRYVAVRAGQRAGLSQGDVTVVEPGETIVYAFCGLGGQRNCALPGKATVERSLLLRREALELSLYTFKHMDNIDSVVTLLPPPAENQNLAVFLQRKQVEDALDKPLAMSLPSAGPHFMGEIDQVEAQTINRYTELQFFRSGFELAPDQSVILNLEPPTAQ